MESLPMANLHNSDVVILGGGVIGITCAYYLQKAGRQVRIIEQNEVGSGASHGNCGWACFTDILPLCSPGLISDTLIEMIQRKSSLHIRPKLDFGLLNWLFRFSRNCNHKYVSRIIKHRHAFLNASEELYRTLLAEEKIHCDWESNGILKLYKEEKNMAGYAETNDILKRYGLEATPFVGQALHEKEPAVREDVFGGWFHGTDHHLRPDKFVGEMKSVILKKGAIIDENCRIKSLNTRKGKVVNINTSKGDVAADHFVFALGAWSRNFARQLNLKIPVQPGKGYSITTSKPSLCPESLCYFFEKHVIGSPWKSGFRLGGLLSFSGYDTNPEPKRFNYLREASKAYLKVPMGDTLQEEWVGLRPMSCDDMPIIGWSPVHTNFMMATGHSMLGMSMAPATGKLVADMVTGQAPFMDPTVFSIKRFQ
jgi:D-amino-acid dehydrogenase